MKFCASWKGCKLISQRIFFKHYKSLNSEEISELIYGLWTWKNRMNRLINGYEIIMNKNDGAFGALILNDRPDFSLLDCYIVIVLDHTDCTKQNHTHFHHLDHNRNSHAPHTAEHTTTVTNVLLKKKIFSRSLYIFWSTKKRISPSEINDFIQNILPWIVP